MVDGGTDILEEKGGVKLILRADGTNRFGTARSRSTGTVTVELALVLPLILLLLFSILEMGFMLKHRAELGQAARESARLGAVAATPARMTEGVNSSLTTIPTDGVTIDYQYRAWDEDAGAWGAWTALSTIDGRNSASTGDQIRVRLSYDHHLLVPGLMAPVLNAGEDGALELSASSVMMRE
ncbi:MAG: TadE/TadG family type IV pilus assembly protein [Armatimonadota bacterium]